MSVPLKDNEDLDFYIWVATIRPSRNRERVQVKSDNLGFQPGKLVFRAPIGTAGFEPAHWCL